MQQDDESGIVREVRRIIIDKDLEIARLRRENNALARHVEELRGALDALLESNDVKPTDSRGRTLPSHIA